jgi:hypothetical protein
VLTNLPMAPHRAALNGKDSGATKPARGYHYLYRVNCGGPDYTDHQGNLWRADRDLAAGDNWGSVSWAAVYDNVPQHLGSQRETFDPIAGTRDEGLFQTFRYGREKLRYLFAVPDGKYQIELFFIEPWYGRGGGDCTGWRLFDVAVNGETKLRDVDLWSEVGYCRAVKKSVTADVRGGWLEISFPRVASYQAVLSGIAIATKDAQASIPATSASLPEGIQRLMRSKTVPAQTNATVDSAATVYAAALAKSNDAVQEGDAVRLSVSGAALARRAARDAVSHIERGRQSGAGPVATHRGGWICFRIRQLEHSGRKGIRGERTAGSVQLQRRELSGPAHAESRRVTAGKIALGQVNRLLRWRSLELEHGL